MQPHDNENRPPDDGRPAGGAHEGGNHREGAPFDSTAPDRRAWALVHRLTNLMRFHLAIPLEMADPRVATLVADCPWCDEGSELVAYPSTQPIYSGTRVEVRCLHQWALWKVEMLARDFAGAHSDEEVSL